jgi:dTDP-4-amino-4,6-dideoxygalactose transaminase/CelD/BcsL family acetyltransferase involved in cellulose biosynthesis
VTGRLATTPPLPADVWLRTPQQPLAFPLASPGCRLCSSAAQALRLGLGGLALAPGDEVLVPMHHDRVLVEQLLRAGLRVAYYGCGAGGEPDETEFECATTTRTRALMLVHALGVAQDARRWRGFCDTRGLLLLEDATHAWSAEIAGVPVGAFGDLALFSFSEAIGLAGVAAVLTGNAAPIAEARALDRQGLARAARSHARWLTQHLPLTPAHELPVVALELLARLADPDVAAARRMHYKTLLDALGDHVPEPWRQVGDGAAPSVFPIELPEVARVRDRLTGLGIGTREVWSTPHPSLDADRTARVLRRQASSLGLPVHQRLRPSDVERIARAVGGRRHRSELRVEPLTSLESARADCELLCARDGNIFTTFEWMSAWCGHLRDGDELRLASCRDAAGAAVGLLPLVTRHERGLRVARLLGHGPSDRLAPICAPDDRPRVAAALRRALHDSGCDLFVGEQMPADEGWGAAIGATVLEREANPVLHIGGLGWEEFLARRSSNFRQQVRRRERRLARDGELRYRLADDPARLAGDLDTLIELHEARWHAGGSKAFAGARRALHHEFAAHALASGWLRLWLLEIDGRAAAAWYGFRYGGAEWFYQSGRDMSAGGDAVGFVLLCHTIREAMNDGMREYRLLRGDEAYKARFADRDPGLQTVALALSVRGRAALSARRARPVAGRALRSVRAVRGSAAPSR